MKIHGEVQHLTNITSTCHSLRLLLFIFGGMRLRHGQ